VSRLCVQAVSAGAGVQSSPALLLGAEGRIAASAWLCSLLSGGKPAAPAPASQDSPSTRNRPGYLRGGFWPVASARMRRTEPCDAAGGLELIAVFPLLEPAPLESGT
jgi:hypothetical protein